VNVGAADRRGGDADQRVERADVGNRLLVEHDATGFDEDRSFHLRHGRAALAALERDGLVTLVPNRGAFVAEPSIEDARDVFFARSTIEGRLVERLCATVRPEDIARLEAHIAEERAARARGDVSSAIRLSGGFHILLAELAGSRSLFQVLRDLVSRTSLITAMYHPQSRTDCGPDEHMEIVGLIARGEVAAAKRAMDEHLAHIESRLVLEEETGVPKDLRAILA
jgi:DNA-binding GntR family transcriptional regulator